MRACAQCACVDVLLRFLVDINQLSFSSSGQLLYQERCLLRHDSYRCAASVTDGRSARWCATHCTLVVPRLADRLVALDVVTKQQR